MSAFHFSASDNVSQHLFINEQLQSRITRFHINHSCSHGSRSRLAFQYILLLKPASLLNNFDIHPVPLGSIFAKHCCSSNRLFNAALNVYTLFKGQQIKILVFIFFKCCQMFISCFCFPFSGLTR